METKPPVPRAILVASAHGVGGRRACADLEELGRLVKDARPTRSWARLSQEEGDEIDGGAVLGKGRLGGTRGDYRRGRVVVGSMATASKVEGFADRFDDPDGKEAETPAR